MVSCAPVVNRCSRAQPGRRQSFIKHREYIAANPVKAGLVERPEEFPSCFTYLARRKAAGAKALK
jgi:hypothetical protein